MKSKSPKWRTGKKLGRTLYIGDELVGMMDSSKVANEIVFAMNFLKDMEDKTNKQMDRKK